ncbi:MAG: lipoprotein [Gammaproteobacteria bacterium]|nr:lipoprotein [Gammaproteobacteria bacterium]MDH5650351.1 lipoprotein [Gammaproteobacteria bacterium]
MRLCYSILLTMMLIMLTSAATLLAGCGQKGPLFLPAPAATGKSTTTGPDATNTDPKETTKKSNPHGSL